jgi:hypothetical protein
MGGAGPIPFTVIDRWAQRFGPKDDEGFEDFYQTIRALDIAFLATESDKRKRS